MRLPLSALAFFVLLVCGGCTDGDSPKPVVWKVDNIQHIGGLPAEVIGGAPKVVDDGAGGKAVRFDGKGEGLLLPAVPIAGWEKFTVEIEFFPETDGAFEQRFMHMEDSSGWPRALFEIRLNLDGSWYLDTFLANNSATDKRALIDPSKTHPAGRWYCATLVYDGAVMSNYVDGVKQGEGAVRFGPVGKGKTSLGVRQNKVHWFKGMIREVRFYPEARVPSGGK